MEVWKDIPNYENHYKASTYGRIKSLIGWNGKRYIKREKILKPTVQQLSKRYFRLKINLSINKKIKQYTVHKLIAMTFIPNDNKNLEIDHIDSNPLNNHVDNLRWITHKENISRSVNNRLYGNIKRKVIRGDGEIFESLSQAGKAIGVTKSTIHAICNGRRKRAKGFNFKYYKESD
jgi:hypothetical protein